MSFLFTFLLLLMKTVSRLPLSSSLFSSYLPALPSIVVSTHLLKLTRCLDFPTLLSTSLQDNRYSCSYTGLTSKTCFNTTSPYFDQSIIFYYLLSLKRTFPKRSIQPYSLSHHPSPIAQNTPSYSNRSIMAWRSSGNTNKELVDRLRDNGVIKSSGVYNAMIIVDRSNFINTRPYEDSPQPLGYGATISAPHMHAYALEYLKDNLKEGNRVLDVGSGTGYLTACFAYMVGATEGKGMVIGIDCVNELVEKSKSNIEKQNPKLLTSEHFKLYKGNGWKGDKDNGPYNAIHVGAAASEIPSDLVDQLAPGGQLVVPVDASHGYGQHLKIITKDAQTYKIIERNLIDVSFVPLRKNPDI